VYQGCPSRAGISARSILEEAMDKYSQQTIREQRNGLRLGVAIILMCAGGVLVAIVAGACRLMATVTETLNKF
jgi:hypothetical protein